MTETGLSLGTPHYMSPEQATGGPGACTGRRTSTRWACVLYEMLVGDPPYRAARRSDPGKILIAQPVPDVTKHRKLVPPNVARRSRRRSRSSRGPVRERKAFAKALRNPHFGAETTAIAAGAAAPAARRRRPLLIGIAAGALAGAFVMWLGLRNRTAGCRRRLLRAAHLRPGEHLRGPVGLGQQDDPLYDGRRRHTQRAHHPAEYPEPQPFGPDSAALLAVSPPTRWRCSCTRGGWRSGSSPGRWPGCRSAAARRVRSSTTSRRRTGLRTARSSPSPAASATTISSSIRSGRWSTAVRPGSYLSDPRVSADGRRVALFLHPLRYDDRGFVPIVEGSGTVTRGDEEFAGLEGLAWSSDGRSVLFSAAQGSPYEIHRWTPGGRAVKLLPSAGRLTMYDARAGRWLVTRDDQVQLIVAKAPGAPGVRDVSWLDGSISPKISADGRLVAFTDQGTLSGALYGVMVRKTDGSAAVRLGDGNVRAISSDKRWVLADLPTSPRQYRLYPIGAGSFRPLVWPKLANIIAIGFLPDGKALYLCGNEPDRAPRCYRSALEGGDVTPVTPDSILGFPRRDLGAVAAGRDGKWWIYPTDGGPRREIPGLTQGPLRWSPDGTALWVFRPGPAGHRGVDRVEVATGRRTPLFDIEELQGIGTPFVLALSIADDGRSYAYFTLSYNSLLFSVEGVR